MRAGGEEGKGEGEGEGDKRRLERGEEEEVRDELYLSRVKRFATTKPFETNLGRFYLM